MARRISNPVRDAAVEAVVVAAEEVDTGVDAVIATDSDGTILYWSAGAERLFGWKALETLDRNVVDVTRGSQFSTDAERIMRELMAGQSWSGTFVVRHKDGTPVPVQVTDVPIMAGGVVAGIVGVSRPIPDAPGRSGR
jgi:PAS domain S-box-containing protein